MITSLIIGRAETLDHCAVVSMSGDQVMLSGTLPDGDLPVLQAVRAQLLGLVGNRDELYVPVTYNEDSTLDGFYSVDSVSLPADRPDHWDYDIGLTRAPGSLFQSSMLGALRTNSKSIEAGTEITWHAVPAATLAYYDGGIGAGAAQLGPGGSPPSRLSEDGGIAFYQKTGSPSFHNARPRFSLAPADYYKGAAKLFAGSHRIVGRRVSDLLADWQITNGLVRMNLNGASFDLQGYSGSAWSTAKSWSVGSRTTLGVFTTAVAPVQRTVLRNSPELVAVRYTFSSSAVFPTNSDVYLDISLRRGDRMFRCHLVCNPAPGTDGIAFFRSSTEAGTAITGGLRATNDDGDGHRYVLAAPGAAFDSTRGGVSGPATASMLFGVGLEINHATAPGIDTPQNLVYQYMAADTEHQTLVAR